MLPFNASAERTGMPSWMISCHCAAVLGFARRVFLPPRKSAIAVIVVMIRKSLWTIDGMLRAICPECNCLLSAARHSGHRAPQRPNPGASNVCASGSAEVRSDWSEPLVWVEAVESQADTETLSGPDERSIIIRPRAARDRRGRASKGGLQCDDGDYSDLALETLESARSRYKRYRYTAT